MPFERVLMRLGVKSSDTNSGKTEEKKRSVIAVVLIVITIIILTVTSSRFVQLRILGSPYITDVT